MAEAMSESGVPYRTGRRSLQVARRAMVQELVQTPAEVRRMARDLGIKVSDYARRSGADQVRLLAEAIARREFPS